MKKQGIEWDRIFMVYLSNKGWLCKINKELLKLSNKVTNIIVETNQSSERTHDQRRYSDGKNSYEKILNITCY